MIQIKLCVLSVVPHVFFFSLKLNLKIPLINFIPLFSIVMMSNSVPLDCLPVSDMHNSVWWKSLSTVNYLHWRAMSPQLHVQDIQLRDLSPCPFVSQKCLQSKKYSAKSLMVVHCWLMQRRGWGIYAFNGRSKFDVLFWKSWWKGDFSWNLSQLSWLLWLFRSWWLEWQEWGEHPLLLP